MAKVSRVISMEMWNIGLGIKPKIIPSFRGLIAYPITPAPVTRSIIAQVSSRDKRKTIGKRKGKKK